MSSVAIIGTRGYPSYYGGFETAVRKLAPYLADRDWDVTVYGRKGMTRDADPSADSRIRRIVTSGIETRSLSTLSYGLTACLHAAGEKPDVVLLMNVANGYFLPLLKAQDIPTLVNVDGIEWDRAKWGRLAKAVFRIGARLTARYGTRTVYDSQEIARRWNEEFNRDGDFIPYGGDVVGELPIEPGLTHRGYVLVVVRFVPENTIAEFTEAAESISRSHQVVIVGSSGYGGGLEERVRVLSEQRSSVTWLGHISDDVRLLSLWQHAGVYFHGHSVGGTNPALVQAMACGAPIVARDTPYNREVLGDEGALYAVPNAGSISAQVSELMTSPMLQELLSTRVLERAVRAYRWTDICESYHKSLTELVANKGRK